MGDVVRYLHKVHISLAYPLEADRDPAVPCVLDLSARDVLLVWSHRRILLDSSVALHPCSLGREHGPDAGPSRCLPGDVAVRETSDVPPETHYARSGDVSIAYQVLGN